jgi:MYXO-CTERM domain-containing protein
MRATCPSKYRLKLCFATALALVLTGAVQPARAQGTWTQVSSSGGCGNAFGLWLLTDGRVLAHGCGGLQTWQILTPDKAGNYATGTWKAVASSAHARGGAQQHVLKDGRFFVGGGEYIDGPACTPALCNTAEIYDPVANTWKNTANAPHDIGDTGSTTLADGTILESTRAGSQVTVYDPTADTWTAKASSPLGSGDENSWASLQNGDVLAVGYHVSGAALYIPSMDKWVKTSVPSGFDTGDMAGISQMFDGRVYVYGLNGKAYIWTPGPAVTDPGSWVTTTLITTNGATENEDEYTDTLPNGMVWGALVAKMYGSSVVLQQFDPTTNTATAVTGLPKETNPDPIDYLNLPNGQVMITVESGSHNWVLTPDGQPQDAWRPTVTSVTYNSAANTYTLIGTQTSGLINGGDEGDDMTMAENYPIIWLKDSSNNVTYCKSFNFSNMMPSKGSAPQTADFTLPSTVTTGSYQLYVSAVGVISKNPFPFTVGQSTTTGAAGASGSTGGTTGTGGATGGASGSAGMAGSSGKGGTTGSGGTTTTGTGGTTTTGTGGTATTGTGGTTTTGTGGTTTGTGGTTTTGTGGTTTTGTGGLTGSGGSASTGGAIGSGGTTTGGGTTGETGASSGCSCQTTPGGSNLGVLLGFLAIGLVGARRRRGMRRSTDEMSERCQGARETTSRWAWASARRHTVPAVPRAVGENHPKVNAPAKARNAIRLGTR